MSGGVAVDFSALSKAGASLAEGLEKQRTQSLLQALGGQVQSGDYAGAAKTAFDAGDLQTGLSLVKLGESKAQAADYQKGFGGGLAALYGGQQPDAVTGTPATVAPTRGPSFTDASGPAGSYLAVLRGKESGGNANAKNPNSTATGIDQFTKQTWDGLRAKYPELGLTANGRTDPAQSTRAMEKFTADNARALTSAGVPITPGNLYVSHFLGEAGGPRFIRGAMQNPDAPATAYVTPGAAAANRTVFFNRDGSPKTAGQVLAERTSKFGGATTRVSGTNPDAPASRVQVASADPSFMPTLPNATASAAPAAPAPTVSSGGAPMILPPEADTVQPEQRVQVAQAAPQVLVQSGLKPAAAAQMQQMQPGSAQRIQFLVRAMSHPGAPEGGKEAAKALLANELQLDRENRQTTSEQKEYLWDVANGFKGDPMAWRAAKANATRAPEKDGTEKVAAARQNWRALGLPDPSAPENAAFWKDFGSRALGGGALVNVDTRAEGAESTGLAAARVKDSETYQTAGQAAAARLPDIETLRTLSRNLGVQGVEASIKEGLAPYAQALGVKLDGVGDIQAYSGIIAKLTPNMRPPGSGATSDFEQKMYAKALPGLLQLPEARELVFDMMQAQAQGEIQRGDIATRYRNGEIKAAEYAQALRAVPNPLDMFRKFREANPTLVEDAIKRSDEPGRPLPKGQRDASASGPLKAAPAATIQQAREAIASGKRSSEQVIQKLKDMGYSSAGL